MRARTVRTAVEDDTHTQRNMDVLREFAAREPTGKPLVVRFLFFRSPVAIHGESIAQVRG